MCGLVGELQFDGGALRIDAFLAARDRLSHRGPDDAGFHAEPGVALGHRRLSIIDLSAAGRMPMCNETEDVWAVFNGEIYNFASLRAQLEAKGHAFRSHTDSEVSIHAYEEWGTGCFARFDGMFAIAIWDRRRRRMVLARDITGEKPLYYALDDRGLRFASTVAPLLDNSTAIDPAAVRAYAELGYVPAPQCIVRGIAKVEPATFVVVGADGVLTQTRYWSLERAVIEQPRRWLSIDDATDELQRLLRTTVRSRLIADVPLGAFLSGGIDSSLVVALMAEVSPDAVRTFTIGFDDPAFDESRHAGRVANQLGVQNTSLVISTADVLRELQAIPAAFDEPLADASVLPSMAVARLARQHVTVALTGDGADEAFGGYRYYAGTRLFERFVSFVPLGVRARLAATASLVPNARVARALKRVVAEDAATYFARSGFHRGGTATSSLRRILPDATGLLSSEQTIISYIHALEPLRPVEAGMLWDATHTLPGAWLTKVDRTTMSVSLEARAPFLARDVLEFAFRLPLDYRVRGTQKKILLRRLLGRYLPKHLFERPKQGFAPPLRSWLANELRSELYDRLTPRRLARFGVFDANAISSLLEEQRTGAIDHTQMLWALFCLDRWYDEYVVATSATVARAQATEA